VRAARILPLLLTLLLPACSPWVPPPEPDPYALPGEGEAGRSGLLHEVNAGESWESLAEDYYGDAARAGRLRRSNHRQGLHLSPGVSIFVPLDLDERRAFEERAQARAPYNKGLELARAGRFPDAILQFQEALQLDPDLDRAHYNLGLVYLRGGRPALALEALSRACELKRRNPAYCHALGGALAELGRPKEAEKLYRRALKIDESHLPSLHALARSLDARGREREARRYWSRYLRLDPGSARGEEAARRLGSAP
jgi:tetratricopeptide (TPR) repeat protein